MRTKKLVTTSFVPEKHNQGMRPLMFTLLANQYNFCINPAQQHCPVAPIEMPHHRATMCSLKRQDQLHLKTSISGSIKMASKAQD